MRRVALILMYCGVFQLAVPAPAQAWYEWIDQLSGPGHWWGWHFDSRLVCFGDPPTGPPLPPDGKQPSEQAGATTRGVGIKLGCPINDRGWRKTQSIGLEFRIVGAAEDQQFARNIQLVTIEPSYSVSLFPTPSRNVIDVGMAAGVYWFSSEEFQTFNGWIIEPIRVDLHLPPGYSQVGFWHALAKTAILRVGIIVFPSGFEPNAFAGAKERTVRLPAESTLAVSFLGDLQPLIRYFRNRQLKSAPKP